MKKILIVGGGIAGPALAIQLKKHGVPCEVTLIEQAPEFKNIGYGIALWGNGRNVLREIGIDQTVITREGYEIPWEVFESPSHKILQTLLFAHFKKFGPTLFIPRAIFHKTLIDQLDPNIIKLNTKIASINKNTPGGVEVTLTNGETHHYDLLVAADGIHSSTREQVFGPSFLESYGYSFWMFWVPPGFSPAKGAVGMAGDGKFAFLYPGYEKAVMMLAMRRKPGIPDEPTKRKEFLVENFKSFGGSISQIIQSLDEAAPILFSDAQHVVLPEWYKERIAFIGDAKHAISPLTGMGASLALEDACVLAQELSRQTDIDAALKAFSARRTPRVSKFQKQILIFERLVLGKGLFARLRNFFMPLIPSRFLLRPVDTLLEGEM